MDQIEMAACGYDENDARIPDFKTALELAERMTASEGRLFLGCDAGRWCSPQFTVVAAPAVGDAVSYAFNGDSYPCGTIVSVGGGVKRRVVAQDEDGSRHVFYRRKLSAGWVREGGTWSLVHGTHDERNPSF